MLTPPLIRRQQPLRPAAQEPFLEPDSRYIYGTSVARAVFIRHRKDRNVYQLCWKEQGRERTRSFHTRHEAEQERQRRLKQISQGNAPDPIDTLTRHEQHELMALHEHSRAKGYSLWEAVRTHEKFLERERVPAISVGEAVKHCLKDKEDQGDAPRTLRSLRSVLGRFALLHHGRLMEELGSTAVTSFVDALDISLRTRLGYLSDLRTFFSWALQKNLIGVNPVVPVMPGRAARRRIMFAKRSRRKEQVLSVEECESLLRWVETNDRQLLVYPVLCLFAGLRPELEATGIEWSDVTHEHITVDASIAKDGETRIIEPLTPNLVEWIGVIRQSSQSPLPLTNLRRRWDRAKQVLDRKWPHDAMRHSYASYHFAMFGNAGLTSKNLGHPDTTLLRKDYNGAVTKAQAKTFWAILPKHCR